MQAKQKKKKKKVKGFGTETGIVFVFKDKNTTQFHCLGFNFHHVSGRL